MKNWILWLVMALVFLGAGVTFFILWHKERKKAEGKTVSEPVVNKSTNTGGIETPTSTNTSTEPVQELAITEQNIGGRSVAGFVPVSFGSTN